METLTTLKVIHIAATVLLLLSGLGLALLAWRKRSAGPAVTVQRPWAFVWLLMGICLVSMPFTGWWLVHLTRLAAGADLDSGLQHSLHRGGAGVVLAGGAA